MNIINLRVYRYLVAERISDETVTTVAPMLVKELEKLGIWDANMSRRIIAENGARCI